MLIDCDTCQVRGLRCGDCVVTVLLGAPRPASAPARAERDRGPGDVPSFDSSEQAAIAALAEGGLIPPLRLITDRSMLPTERNDVIAVAEEPHSRRMGIA